MSMWVGRTWYGDPSETQLWRGVIGAVYTTPRTEAEEPSDISLASSSDGWLRHGRRIMRAWIGRGGYDPIAAANAQSHWTP